MVACPRCKGLVITQYGDTRCLLCGYYKIEPYVEPHATRCMDCGGPPEPEMVRCRPCQERSRSYARAKRGACIECGQEPTIKGRLLGPKCHGRHISRGMADTRSAGR